MFIIVTVTVMKKTTGKIIKELREKKILLKMKKLLILAVLLALCTSMAWTQAATINGVTISVNAKENYVSDSSIIQPKQGSKYFAIDVTIVNNSGKTISYNVLDFTLQDGQAYTYTYTPGKDPFLNCGDLERGRSVRGWITFEVPAASSNYTVIYKPSMVGKDQLILKL